MDKNKIRTDLTSYFIRRLLLGSLVISVLICVATVLAYGLVCFAGSNPYQKKMILPIFVLAEIIGVSSYAIKIHTEFKSVVKNINR